LEYDTIYHEHLSYISVKPLIPFFAKFEMEIFDIQQVDIHGGSFRVFVARKGKMRALPVVKRLFQQELKEKIHSSAYLEKFAQNVADNRRQLTWLLNSLKRKKKHIAGVSAPAKGMTLLNYCKIGRDILDFLTENQN